MRGWPGQWCTALSVITLMTTLFLGGCSKPEEVISGRIALAHEKLDAGRSEEAVDILEKLNRAHPDTPVVLEALGFAYARAGKPRDAATCFVRAADLDSNSSTLRQLAAEAFLRDGAPERAAEQHRLFLAEFPGDFQSWQKLGEIEEQLGNLQRAIEAYLEWYRIHPEGEAAYRLGAAFRRLNNAPQAKSWFEATIRHGEAHIEDALMRLLELEIEAGDFAAAERTVSQIDRSFPGALDASPLAGVRGRIAAWREAEAAVAAARAEQERLATELAESRRRQQEELRRAREPERPGPEPTSAPAPSAEPETPAAPAPAATEIPAALELPPALRAAIERKENGEVEKAVELLWRALGNDDSRVEFWAELADCYRLLRQYTQAEACILEARRRAPESIEIEISYLNIVHEAQPPEVYLTRLEAARQKFPGSATIAYSLAHTLAETNNDVTRTVAAFDDFLLLADPADPRREEANAYLARARSR